MQKIIKSKFFVISIFVIFLAGFFVMYKIFFEKNIEDFPQEIVQIVMKHREKIVQTGYGFRSGQVVITAEHIVGNNLHEIWIDNMQYTILHHENHHDIACLWRETIETLRQNCKRYIFVWAKIGEVVYIWRKNDEKYEKIFGKIIAVNTEKTAYDVSGRLSHYTSLVETNISVQSGESGMPIYNMKWEKVGIIHQK